MIDEAKFTEVFPKADPNWLILLEKWMKFYDFPEGINTLAMVLAQLGHESAGFTVLEENLRYSPERALAMWPQRLGTLVRARAACRTPENLANIVYGGRMGNTDHGDGWRYRGRGLIQLTGKDNYRAFSQELPEGMDFMNHPELLCSDKDLAACCACWFLAKRTGSKYWRDYAAGGDVEACTKMINGGLIGLADRRRLFLKLGGKLRAVE